MLIQKIVPKTLATSAESLGNPESDRQPSSFHNYALHVCFQSNNCNSISTAVKTWILWWKPCKLSWSPSTKRHLCNKILTGDRVRKLYRIFNVEEDVLHMNSQENYATCYRRPFRDSSRLQPLVESSRTFSQTTLGPQTCSRLAHLQPQDCT